MQGLIDFEIDDLATSILRDSGIAGLAPLIATAEMRNKLTVRALANMYHGKIVNDTSKAGEYVQILKGLDDSVHPGEEDKMMRGEAMGYTSCVIDAVLDASEMYKAGTVPMGMAATGNPAIDLAQAFKDAHASNAMEHMKEATQSQEEERHAMVTPRHH